MDFLEKSLSLSNGYGGQPKISKIEPAREKIPERPKWETSKPLKAIKAQREIPSKPE